MTTDTTSETSTEADYSTTPLGKLKAGDYVSFTDAAMTWGEVWPRGASVQLTPDLIRRTVGTDGRSWLDDVDDDGARIQRGRWPSGAASWRYGDPEWQEAREAARRRAWAILDPAERAAAREAVEREYGPAPSTTKTLNSAPDPAARAASEQRQRLDGQGLQVRSSYAPNRREA